MHLMGDAITDPAILKYDSAAFEKKSASEAWLKVDADRQLQDTALHRSRLHPIAAGAN